MPICGNLLLEQQAACFHGVSTRSLWPAALSCSFHLQHPPPSPSPRHPPSWLWRSLLGLLLLHFMHRLALVFCVLLDSNCIASCQLWPLPRSATACCKCCKQQLELASRLAKGTNDELSSINWRSANLLTVTWPSCIPRARGACVAHSALWADFA